MKPLMLRITGRDDKGRDFCAGIISGGPCAPILYWMKRKRWNLLQIKKHCQGKGWTVEEM